MNKYRNERGGVTAETTEIQTILRKYYEQLNANNLDNLGEVDKFLEAYSLQKLSQKETENLNRLIATTKIKSVITNPQPSKVLGHLVSQVNFTQHSKKD